MTHVFDVFHVCGDTLLKHLFLFMVTALGETEFCSLHPVPISDSTVTGKYKSRTGMYISQLF